MAVEVCGRYLNPAEHGSEVDVATTGQPVQCFDISSNGSGHVLLDRMLRVLLGLQ